MLTALARETIIAEALTWEGTPWHHWACLKGVGVDCVRYPEGVAKALGTLAATWHPPRYTKEWHLHQQESILEAVLEALGLQRTAIVEPGDLLLFRYGQTTAHLAIALAPDEMIHASLTYGKVVREPLDGPLQRRLQVAYSFPGVITP